MARPRVHHQLSPDKVSFESDFDNASLDALRVRGHVLSRAEGSAGHGEIIGVVQVVQCVDGLFSAANDELRKSGRRQTF